MTLRPLEVLVVDDDQASRTVLREAVEGLGHRCRVAGSGLEALRMHDARRAEVIISDWRMPGMDGMELCRRVRALDGGSYAYLLFTTGSATKRDVVEAIRAGADDYLPKPVDLDELEARLIAAGRVVRAYRELADRNSHLRHDSRVFFRAARIDPLTRVANRLRLEEDLAVLEAAVVRYGRRVCVAMCDLDGFKAFNDHYGHLAGDEALRRIAYAIRDALRQSDRVYRYGGEEFLVALPEQGVDEALQAMERVRAAVETLRIEHAPGAGRRLLTISVGVAPVVCRDGLTARDAIAEADLALYRAKSACGNRLEGP